MMPEHMREHLVQYFGFKPSNVIVLTDHAKNKPTRSVILGALNWLVEGAAAHDSLFIHYSGHGGQAPDDNGDEADGWDEVIYPLDYKENSFIRDDQLHEMLVSRLPPGCRLTAVFDACHSGTVLDLPRIYSSTCRERHSHISNRSRTRGQSAADVICFSSCRDGETSADTFQGGMPVGAMSWAWLSALKRKEEHTYKSLLTATRQILEKRYAQRPQLGSNHEIVSPSISFAAANDL
ncbi:peptidase C14, caspase domain-containing protein [Flagelloscypha sp. PMI_526]|nr:peptidase C14, caspase domain-containing protein [Flagelloscypha sp. PMI_526]